MHEASASAPATLPSVDGAGPFGGPPDPTLLGRWTTTTRPPPAFFSVIETLVKVNNGDGLPSRKTVIKTIRKNVGEGTVYTNNDAEELYEFLVRYAAIEQLPNGRWTMNASRCRELEIAIDNRKPLPFDFIVTNTPGEACGCPQPANSVVPPKADEEPAVKPSPPVVDAPKLFVVERVAYMTASEIKALEAIAICQASTVVGELRSPMHMTDEVFAESDIGKCFGGERDLFVVELHRFVRAGIVEIRPNTGPDGQYDVLVLPVPYDDLKGSIVPITVRYPIAVPRHVVDAIDRVLALEGLNVSKGGLHATVRASVVARLKSRRIAVQPDKLADVITHRMIRHHPAALEKGWGLAAQGRGGVDAVICFPGLTPVEFVPIARDIFAEDVETEQSAAPPPPPPSFIAVGDIGEGTDEALLDQVITEWPAVLEAAQAEKARRAEVAARAARRAELEQKREAAAEQAVRKAAEAEAAAAELRALEEELAGA